MAENATTTPPEFSLVHDPWIPTIDGDVSLHGLLTHSRDIDRIDSGDPATDVAILRYVLATIYRAYALYTDCGNDEDVALDTWKEVWDAPTLYTDEVARYLNEHGEAMTLRNLLVPEMMTQKGEWQPTSVLYPTRSLFPTNIPGELTPAEAARAILYVNAWDTAGIKTGVLDDPRTQQGRVYGATIGSLGWAGATTIHGATIHETLCLNWVPTLCDKDDTPTWELAPFHPGGLYPEDTDYRPGTAELLTWQTRRVNMLWQGDHAIGVLRSRGDNIMVTAYEGAEPMTSFNLSKDRTKKAAVPVYTPAPMYTPECSWKCAGGVIPSAPHDVVNEGVGQGSPVSRPPETTRFLGLVASENLLPDGFVPRMSHISYVYGTKSAVIEGTRTTAFPVPSAALGDGTCANTVVAATDYTDKVVKKAVRQFVWALDIASGGDGNFDKRNLVTHVTSFYRELSDEFNRWLETLQPDEGDGELERWKHQARNRALTVATTLVEHSPVEAFSGKSYEDKHYTAPNALDVLRQRLTPKHEGGK